MKTAYCSSATSVASLAMTLALSVASIIATSSPASARDEIKPYIKEKSKPEVKVLPLADKDNVNKPDSWEPEVAGGINNYSDYATAKSAAYDKRQKRNSAAYARKRDADVEIIRRYQKLELLALKELESKDLDSAVYWLEIRAGYGFSFEQEVIDREPKSEAYAAFKAEIKSIEKRKDPEFKAAEAANDAATKKAEEIYDAEIAKLDELYDKVRDRKS